VTGTGNGTYGASDKLPTTGTVAGTYTWHVSYASDANNNSAVDQGGTVEQTVVSKASPAITASPGATVVLGTGVKLTASATISGGYYETGTITFTLDAPSNTVVDTETVPVSGNGTYTTPSGYLPSIAGTYHWVAGYGGDGNNNGASTTTGSTPEVAVGPGTTVVGNALYLVGGNTNDQLNITPIGASQTGSTGINVNGKLNNVNINNQTYTQAFTTIYVVGFGGNDNFQFAGSLTIAAVISDGDGNDQVQLDNGTNTVTLGKGNDNIQGGGGCTQGGNGTNTITAGNGNDQVQLGNGNNTVTLGTGNDNIQLGNGTNTVTAGAVGSTGNIQVTLGNGANDNVTLLGNGNDTVTVGNGNKDTVSVSNGNDTVTVGNGTGDSVSLMGNGNDTVQTGTGSGTVYIAPGTTGNKTLNLGKGWTKTS